MKGTDVHIAAGTDVSLAALRDMGWLVGRHGRVVRRRGLLVEVLRELIDGDVACGGDIALPALLDAGLHDADFLQKGLQCGRCGGIFGEEFAKLEAHAALDVGIVRAGAEFFQSLRQTGLGGGLFCEPLPDFLAADERGFGDLFPERTGGAFGDIRKVGKGGCE